MCIFSGELYSDAVRTDCQDHGSIQNGERVELSEAGNDEEYSRITSNINLEEIKRIAIGELGMTYATEGQVIPYESNSNDYMRQADNSQN